MKYDILTWDWKETFDITLLDELLKKYEAPKALQVEDTGSDQYAMVIMERSDTRTAQSIYDAEMAKRMDE